MQLQCPCCDAIFNLEEGFTAAEGKKLAALLAEVQPALGKAIIYYLRLFTPAKRGLKLTKAIKVVDELIALVNAGTVTRDARTNETKRATYQMWVAGIEQMLEKRDTLTLPITHHNYLRTIVFNIASDPSQALTDLPENKKTSSKPDKNEEYAKIQADLRLGHIDQATADQLTNKLFGR